MTSNQSANDELFEDISAQMLSLVGNPNARLRLIAIAGLDTILKSVGGNNSYPLNGEGLTTGNLRTIRDQMLTKVPDSSPIEGDEDYILAMDQIHNFGNDPLVNRLTDLHVELMVEDEQVAASSAAANNFSSMLPSSAAANASMLPSSAAANNNFSSMLPTLPAPAPAPAPVVPNRNAARAQRAAFLNRFKTTQNNKKGRTKKTRAKKTRVKKARVQRK